MPYDALPPVKAALGPVARPGWDAALRLGFRRVGSRSVLAERRHSGPLIVQKPLYPEGEEICHAVLVHAPGGIAGGDRLALDVTLEAAARVMLTTPAAAKWYKSNGLTARQDMSFTVEAGAVLEYLPQENILFNAAEIETTTAVALAPDAAYAGWEVHSLGRRAAGEVFGQGSFRQKYEIRRAGKLIWTERIRLDGDDPLMRSPAGLEDCTVFASMVVAAGEVPAERLKACRALVPRHGKRWGVSALPDIVSARYLGAGAEDAKAWFEAVWSVLRPWYAGCPARRSRLWDT